MNNDKHTTPQKDRRQAIPLLKEVLLDEQIAGFQELYVEHPMPMAFAIAHHTIFSHDAIAYVEYCPN